jgi:hypothetical protein
MATQTYIKTFVADGSGNTLSFVPFSGVGENFSLDAVSVKKITTPATEGELPVNEFLAGTTDNGNEIHFRADTQMIQLMSEFETFANPLAIVTKLQRGSMTKCFVALGDGDFYELEGNATKGVSIIKVHSKNRDDITTPPVAREIRVSWRDSSRQLCRLTQGEIVFLPTTMSHVE